MIYTTTSAFEHSHERLQNKLIESAEATNNLITMPKYRNLKKLTQTDTISIHKASAFFARAWQQFHKIERDLKKKGFKEWQITIIQGRIISGTITKTVIDEVLREESK